MGDASLEWREKIVRVPSQHLGVERLKSAIDAQETIFCVCEVGRDFQIGAGDAELLLDGYCEATQPPPHAIAHVRNHTHPKLKRVDKNLAGCEVSLYQPIPLAAEDAEKQIMQLEGRHEWVCDILDRAYKSDGFIRPRKGGTHAVVPDIVKKKVVLAFELLIRNSFLPLGVGNSVFNHMTLVLLISRCFAELNSETPLLDYLRDPESFFCEGEAQEPGSFRGRIREGLTSLRGGTS